MKAAVLLITSILFVSLSSYAADCSSNKGHDLTFPKGKKVRIVAYNKGSKTYSIGSYDFPGEGTLYALPESLMESIPSLKAIEAVLKKTPEDIVDEVYITQAAIPTLFEKEAAERATCLSGLKK